MEVENQHKVPLPDGLHIRQYVPADQNDLHDLFTRSFGVTRLRDVWDWKFAGSLQPQTPFMMLATLEDELLGMFGAIRVELTAHNTRLEAYQIVDVAVDDRYRRRGVRAELFQAFVGEMRTRNIPLAFGFPSPAHLNPAVRIGDYVDLGRFRRFDISLQRHAAHPRPAVPRLRTSPIASYEEQRAPITALGLEIAEQFPFAVLRSPEYLTHRYLNNPERMFRRFLVRREDVVVGHIVFAIVERYQRFVAAVYELYGIDTAEIASLCVSALCSVTKEAGVSAIQCFLRGQPNFETALCEAGFSVNEEETIHLAVALPRPASGSLADVTDPAAWYVSYGDTDL